MINLNEIVAHNADSWTMNGDKHKYKKVDGTTAQIDKVNGPMTMTTEFKWPWLQMLDTNGLANLNEIVMHNGNKWIFKDGADTLYKKDGHITQVDKTQGPLTHTVDFGSGFQNLNEIVLHNGKTWTFKDGADKLIKKDGHTTMVDKT